MVIRASRYLFFEKLCIIGEKYIKTSRKYVWLGEKYACGLNTETISPKEFAARIAVRGI